MNFLFIVVGAVAVVLALIHYVLLFLTPPHRRLNRPLPPLPPRAIKKEIAINSEEFSVVVGGSGFLGRTLVRQLVARGDKVRVFDIVKGAEKNVQYIVGSVVEESKLLDTFTNARCVYHTASLVEFNNLPWSYEVNVVGTQHVINACIRAGVTRLVYTSSSAVLMDGKGILNGNEETHMYSKTHLTCYGTTKTLAEKLILEANGKNGLRTCALRPGGLFGPGDVLLAGNLSQPHPIFVGPVMQDFMFIENTAHCHILAGEMLTEGSPVPGQYYFISDGSYQCVDFFQKIVKEMGLPPKKVISKFAAYTIGFIIQFIYIFGGGYFHGFTFNANVGLMRIAHSNSAFSTAKVEKEIGYKPLYTIDEAIKITGQYFKKKLEEKKVK